MDEVMKAMTDVIAQLHRQDAETLKLITQLIGSMSRIEDRVSTLERQVEDLASQMVLVRQDIRSMRGQD